MGPLLYLQGVTGLGGAAKRGGGSGNVVEI